MEIQNYFSKRGEVSQTFATLTKNNWMKLTYLRFASLLCLQMTREMPLLELLYGFIWSKLCLNCYFTKTLHFYLVWRCVVLSYTKQRIKFPQKKLLLSVLCVLYQNIRLVKSNCQEIRPGLPNLLERNSRKSQGKE